jgi:hypothetical protein
MGTITRKYNTYTYTREDGKTVIIDKDKNEAYGIRGNKVLMKTAEKYFPHSLVQSLNWISSWVLGSRYKEHAIEYLNRIISLYPQTEQLDHVLSVVSVQTGAKFIENKENWKILQWFLKEQVLTTNNYKFPSEILDEYFIHTTLKNFPPKTAKFIGVHYRSYIEEVVKENKVVLNGLLKLVNSLGDVGFTRQLVDMCNKIDSIRMLHEKVPAEKRKFIDYKNWDNAIRDLRTIAYEQDSEKFRENQTKYNLNFETGEYKIYVPTSRVELPEIGDYFSNCVNGHEWSCFLENGFRFLVIVIDKKTNKRVVCCDIDSETFRIRQYLGKENQSIVQPELWDFKRAYQEYLNELYFAKNSTTEEKSA